MQFEIPKERPSIIKVIGVGGGGSNAVNHMFRLGIKGVDFMICNTDHQALEMSPVPVRVQLGPSLTDGRGAGSIPEIGKNAAIENLEEIRSILSQNTKMVFITAGMGGGTGTGAAPIIAGLAKQMGILTVAIVTIPFAFEGKKRKAQADYGIEELKKNVDTLLVICNDRLREIHGNLKLTEAFIHADDVLAVAAKSIAETITKTLHINVDFADVQTVLKESGVAIMGSAYAEGEDRALSAIINALDSPLLNDNNIEGARYILLNITSGTKEVTMDELGLITDFIQEQAGNTAEVIMGVGSDETLGEKVGVTVIATGFKTKDQLSSVIPEKKEKVVYNLMEDQPVIAEKAPEVQPEVPARDWSAAVKAETIIAEKSTPSQPSAQINSYREPSIPFQIPPVMFEPQPVDEIEMQPMAFTSVQEIVVNDVVNEEEVQQPVAEEEIIVHQLIQEEPVAVSEVADDNDGFVLKVIEIETPSSEAEVIAALEADVMEVSEEPALNEAPMMVVAEDSEAIEVIAEAKSDAVQEFETVSEELPQEETPVVYNLFDEDVLDATELPEANTADEMHIVELSEPVQEDNNTFVFELNMPVIESQETPVVNNVTEVTETPQVINNEEVVASPVMEAVPPVEDVVVNQAPPAPAIPLQEETADDNNDAFLRARARIMQLREMSLKMNSANGLADLEREPAYKRRNIQLDNLPSHGDPQISRYTLSNDQDNKPEIRPNNPFLHDRVD